MRWVSKRSRASTNVAPQNKTRIQFCVIKIQRRRNNEHNKVLVHFYVIIIIICCSFLRMFAVSVWIYLFLFTSKSSNFTSAVTVCGFFFVHCIFTQFVSLFTYLHKHLLSDRIFIVVSNSNACDNCSITPGKMLPFLIKLIEFKHEQANAQSIQNNSYP